MKTNMELYNELITKRIQESISAKQHVLDDDTIRDEILKASSSIIDSIRSKNKLIICGNGGSASDALHFAGEVVGRFQLDRKPWPAVVLNSDVATMTAIANDYGYDDIFARQARAYCQPGDLFIGISTSGNSENVYRAVLAAKDQDAITVALLGKYGGKIAPIVDCPIIVPSDVTARIQECHILIIHIICELVEMELSK